MLFWTPSGPAMIAEPPPIAPSIRVPNNVNWSEVTVEGCASPPERRKNGSKPRNTSPGAPGTETPAGRQSPSGATGVTTAHTSRALCTASSAISASSAAE